MSISIYSLSITVLWISIFVQIISLLRKQIIFKYFSIYALLAMLFFCIIRLILPIEMPFTFTINSETILPTIQTFINTPIFITGNIIIDVNFILIGIWISVALVFLFQRITTYYQLKKLLILLPATKNPKYNDILKLVVNHEKTLSNSKIVIHSSVKSPAIFGFFKPIIILPEIDFTDEELLGIFIHEWAHFRYGHIYIKWIGELIRIVFWWNPLFKTLSYEIAHCLELHSDKKVYQKLNISQRKQYIEVLAKVATNTKCDMRMTNSVCCLVEDNNIFNIKQRCKMIINGGHNKPIKDIIFIVMSFSLFLLSYTIVLQPFSRPDIEYSSEVTLLDSSNSYIKKEGDVYNLYVQDKFVAIINENELDDYKLLEISIYE